MDPLAAHALVGACALVSSPAPRAQIEVRTEQFEKALGDAFVDVEIGAQGRIELRIPVQPDHRFRRKPITDSDSSRSLIPDQPDHRFRSQADHFSAVTGMVQGVWSEGAHGAG